METPVGIIGVVGDFLLRRRERKERERRLALKDKRGRRPECLEERPGEYRRLFEARAAQIDAIFGTEKAQPAPSVLEGLAADSAERTLVVVDAQPGFIHGADPAYYKAMEALVLRARRRGWPIIFLEFAGPFGDTMASLLKIVEGYDRYARVQKHEPSGVREVAQTCRERGWPTAIFQMCGAYSDDCIKDTARDLSLNYRRSVVEIVPRACATADEVANSRNLYDWFSFPLGDNIRLVRSV